MIPWLETDDPFPPVDQALTDPDGLLAAGGDLTPERVARAYRTGIFPWFNEDQPVLWWSTDPRMVLAPAELRISHSLKKRLVHLQRPGSNCEVRVDTCFERVMRACAEPRPGQAGTWISEAMIETYVALHERGIAHSVETWIDGVLAGGLYGLSIGRMFYGESMFARATDASKIALAHLAAFLRQHEYPMIDCQQQTSHLASLGARPIARAEFSRRIALLVDLPGPSRWPDRLVWRPMSSSASA